MAIVVSPVPHPKSSNLKYLLQDYAPKLSALPVLRPKGWVEGDEVVHCPRVDVEVAQVGLTVLRPK